MSPKNGALIKLDGVGKTFYTDEVETHALSNIHLAIKAGEYLAIAGPSGCGKSTLLAILGLLDSPSEGTYLLKGQPVEGLTLAERARVRNREIGFIFQAFNLIGDLTVYQNVELPLTYVTSDEAFSLAAFWRSATARCGRASAGRESFYPPSR
jgi:putative ABC transport system ATP-binding protein